MQTIILKYSPKESHPVLLWQKLFDRYREEGCSLKTMYSILIDYEHCKKVFEKVRKSGEPIRFLWGCSPNGVTEFHFEPTIEPAETGPPEARPFNHEMFWQRHFIYICEATKEGVSFHQYER